MTSESITAAVIDWERIENFIGFGHPDAPVVFLGMEEGLQRDADLRADLQVRSTFEPFMDLKEAQKRLGGPSKFFGANPVNQSTWRPMCHLMLRRAGVSNPTREQRLRYQADHLGRRDGESLLVELLPYPHSDSAQWLYAQFGRYQTRLAYAASLIPHRQKLLRDVFTHRPRELIVAHGKANWPYYKQIFSDAIWNVDGAIECATWRNCRIVLAHGLSSKEFNSDEQLNRFANIALNQLTNYEQRVHTMPVGNSGVLLVPVDDQHQDAQHQDHTRKSLGQLARSHRTARGLTLRDVSDYAKAFAGQGNPTGVGDLERGNSWVHPKFAEGVFRAVDLPEAEKLGRIYRDLKNRDPRS